MDGLADRSDPQPSCASASNTTHHVSCEPQPLQLNQLPPLSQTEKTKMKERGVKAVAEVVRLIGVDEPLWIKSSVDGRLVIDEAIYKKFFPSTDCPTSRIESSKEVVVVQMDATNLLRMFLDTEKWARLFPTIVNRGKTFHLLESVHSEGVRSKLIYEQLHILSTLVQPREFMILRSCKQMEENIWVIADVSYNLPYVDFVFGAPTCSKRPSGCLIQALPNGYSKVTWMEHIEVDNRIPTHELYRDLLSSGFGFGARRWTTTLKRMCERLSLSSISDFPTTHHPRGVITMEGRKCIMALGDKMLREFAGILRMTNKLDFSKLSETDSTKVRVSVRVSKEAGTPNGIILCALSSLSLPVPPLRVFNFLTDLDLRHQWEILCHGDAVDEAVRFATGTDHRNCVTILQPSITIEETRNLRIIQESFIDALGGMMVYAPLDLYTTSFVVSGKVDPANIPILPSGFVISRDGRSSAADVTSGGDNGTTLLTVALQIFVSGPSYSEYVDVIYGLLKSTIQRIKAMLNCSDETHDQ